MADEKQCKNPTCSCPPSEDSDFCGVTCEGKGQVVELDCDCGHPNCTGDF